MQAWARMSELLLGLVDRYDDQAIFLLVFLEESGVPLPLPGDLIMMLAGYRVAQGKMSLVWALFLLESATVLGASILYWLAARGGRPLLYRYGRYIHCDRAKLDRAEAWMQRRGVVAIVLGRIIPGLRIPTALAAGAFGMPYPRFLPALALGAFLYIGFFVLLGLWVGPQAIEALAWPRLSLRAVASVLVFIGLGAFLVMMYRRLAPLRQLAREPASEARLIETSLLAGLLATLEMWMGVDVLLYALGALGLGVPERALIQFLDQAAARFVAGNDVRFAALMLAFAFVGGLIWAVIYSHVAVPLLRPLSPWLRGLVFSALPLAFSVLIVMPVVGAGLLGLGLDAGLLPLVAEVLRNALFGVGLGVSYSLLRLARQRPARAAVAP
jgi:membrane protein DedA with SNARE-associated domain